MNPNPNQNASSDEDLFVEIFQEAVGFAAPSRQEKSFFAGSTPVRTTWSGPRRAPG